MDGRLEALDLDEVLRYMGVPPEKAPEETRALAEGCGRELCRTIQPRWRSREVSVTLREEGVELEGCLLLPGRDLRRHLEGCGRAVVMAVTLSAQADALIRRWESRDMARALALDCCATAAVEALCDRLEEELQGRYPGCSFPYRYSPGYGDLPLSVQPGLLRLLDAPRRMGLCATERYLLTPRKSVTAILGVAAGEIRQEKRSCLSCLAQAGCQYRKSGGHCGIS